MGSLIFKNPAEMTTWGRRLGRILKKGDVIALVGELGAGKTTLVQGIAQGRGYQRGANSPTFALVNEYKIAGGNVYHMDMYRLSERELISFPLEDYWGDGICLIEWADRVRERWPVGTLEINLKMAGPQERTLDLGKPGRAWMKRLGTLSRH